MQQRRGGGLTAGGSATGILPRSLTASCSCSRSAKYRFCMSPCNVQYISVTCAVGTCMRCRAKRNEVQSPRVTAWPQLR